MKIKFYLFTFILITLLIVGCSKKDDDLPTIIDVADRTEQQVIDNQLLIDYFESHYYNSEELGNMANPSMMDIVITELGEGQSVPSGHTLLVADVIADYTTFKETEYTFYMLRVNDGGGSLQPNITDSVLINYQGNLLDETIFDSSASPVVFDLTNLIVGWSRVIPQFNVSAGHTINANGTVTFNDAGVGIMFLPSGLAYFSDTSPPGVPIYSNLIFKFDVYQSETNDHDSDGLPSNVEDVNGDSYVNDDDSDEDSLPNYVDLDDDDDGVLTLNELEPKEYVVNTNLGEMEPILEAKEYELSRSESAGIITIKTVTIVDSNNDGIDDYLDDTVTINYNE